MKYFCTLLLFSFALVFNAHATFAQVTTPGADTSSVTTPGASGPSVTTPGSLFPNTSAVGGTVCSFVTGLLNIVTELGSILGVLFLIWSGFRFIAAQGNEEKLTKAKTAFWYTILGITLLLSASVVARLVVVTVSNVITSGNGTNNSAPAGASSFICSS
jgi:hypothetical protein